MSDWGEEGKEGDEGGRGGVAALGTGLPGEVTLLLSPPKAESYERRRHCEAILSPC